MFPTLCPPPNPAEGLSIGDTKVDARRQGECLRVRVDKRVEVLSIRPSGTVELLGEDWSGREDLNLRPPGPEPGALPG